MELILLAAATAAAGGGALAAACRPSALGACVGLGLAAAGVAAIAAVHDAFTAAAVLLVQAAVGLAASYPAAKAASAASRPTRLLSAVVAAGLGVVLAMALAGALTTGPSPAAEPPRSGVLVLVLGALLLLSAVVGIGALSRRPGPGMESS